MDAVVEYIKKLLTPGIGITTKQIKQSDIGVVAPYRLQCKILTKMCRQLDFNDITVGTAEIFQGQERPIMIISTVRTDMTLGFVNDPRVKCEASFNQSKFYIFGYLFDQISENECHDYTCKMPFNHRWRCSNSDDKSELGFSCEILQFQQCHRVRMNCSEQSFFPTVRSIHTFSYHSCNFETF